MDKPKSKDDHTVKLTLSIIKSQKKKFPDYWHPKKTSKSTRDDYDYYKYRDDDY